MQVLELALQAHIVGLLIEAVPVLRNPQSLA